MSWHHRYVIPKIRDFIFMGPDQYKSTRTGLICACNPLLQPMVTCNVETLKWNEAMYVEDLTPPFCPSRNHRKLTWDIFWVWIDERYACIWQCLLYSHLSNSSFTWKLHIQTYLSLSQYWKPSRFFTTLEWNIWHQN